MSKRIDRRLLKAPFPYFGGKSAVADIIWKKLGRPDHYMEPFFGSGAVLLARPDWYEGCGLTETICDKDGFVANAWRGIQFDPDDVARWCDWPVNHADLAARKLHLIRHEGYLLDGLKDDPKWFDSELAGYWIWAASCWIGSGLTSLGQRPLLACKGRSVAKQSLGQRPHLSHKGMGSHQSGVNIREWFSVLSARLRHVRVVCGDWSRICGGDWQDNGWKTVGMFFDPPYGVSDRANVYHHDGTHIAVDIRDWCKDRGSRENYRIAIAGYEEYQELVDNHGWTFENWKTRGGYAHLGNGRGKSNRHREMLYFSPWCERTDTYRQESMF